MEWPSSATHRTSEASWVPSRSKHRLGEWSTASRWWRGNEAEWDVVAESIDRTKLLVGEVKLITKPVTAPSTQPEELKACWSGRPDRYGRLARRRPRSRRHRGPRRCALQRRAARRCTSRADRRAWPRTAGPRR